MQDGLATLFISDTWSAGPSAVLWWAVCWDYWPRRPRSFVTRVGVNGIGEQFLDPTHFEAIRPRLPFRRANVSTASQTSESRRKSARVSEVTAKSNHRLSRPRSVVPRIAVTKSGGTF